MRPGANEEQLPLAVVSLMADCWKLDLAVLLRREEKIPIPNKAAAQQLPPRQSIPIVEIGNRRNLRLGWMLVAWCFFIALLVFGLTFVLLVLVRCVELTSAMLYMYSGRFVVSSWRSIALKKVPTSQGFFQRFYLLLAEYFLTHSTDSELLNQFSRKAIKFPMNSKFLVF